MKVTNTKLCIRNTMIFLLFLFLFCLYEESKISKRNVKNKTTKSLSTKSFRKKYKKVHNYKANKLKTTKKLKKKHENDENEYLKLDKELAELMRSEINLKPQEKVEKQNTLQEVSISDHFDQNNTEVNQLSINDIKNLSIGFCIGFGLNSEASEEIFKCFSDSDKKNSINQMLKDTSNNIINKDENTVMSKLVALFSFLKCPAFKQTIFTFIKNKFISIGIKGLIYVSTGPLGILVKMGYDIVKISIEIKNYLNSLKDIPVDYIKVGSAIGRIVYYCQDLLLKKKK